MQPGSTPTLLLPADDNRIGIWISAASSSISKGAAVAAPGAGVTVVQLATIPPGLYGVSVQLGFIAGAPVALDSTNWQLILGSGTVISAIFATAASLNQPTARTVQVEVPVALPTLGTTIGLTLSAIAAATAGVTYQGELTANPLTPAYVGLGEEVLSAAWGASSGWPIGPTPQWLSCDQELWVVTPQAGAVDVRVIEVARRDQPFTTRPFEGD
jgi:hypothetical protein